MTYDLTPLAVCERLVGDLPAIARVCGFSDKAAYPWRHGNNARQPGDIPNPILMRKLLAHSDRHALGLTPRHLILGADRAEIEAILAARAGAQGVAA